MLDSSVSQAIGLAVNFTLKALGLIVTPAMPFKLGSVSPSGTEMSKECRSEEKKRNNSILAKISPRHILLPTPNGRKYSGLWTLPSALMNLDGLNFSGSSHREGSMCTAWSNGTIWACCGRWKPFSFVSL